MTLEVNEELLSFDSIANLLVSEEVFIVSPAELHGLLAGQLASGARMLPDIWLKTVLELLDMEAYKHESSKVGLIALYEQTLGQMDGFGLELTMMLPDDDTPFNQRVESLGRWCSGFMTGFGYQGKQTDQTLSAEAKDALNDLSQIAQVASEAEEDEDNESDLMELEEYVRMAALMLFAECNQSADVADEKSPPAQLH